MATLSKIFKTAGKVVKTTGSAAYKATMATGKVSSSIIDDVGEAVIDGSKKVASGAKKMSNASRKAKGTIFPNKANDIGEAGIFIRNATEEELADAGLGGKLVKKRLTKTGMAALAVGTMGVSTVQSIGNNGSKANKMGNISVGDNLDRLISYDGSGFFDSINQVSQGDPEVMTDIVKNSFDNINQYGASGDLVFALHNMREG